MNGSKLDEPAPGWAAGSETQRPDDPPLPDRIRRLTSTQPFAVLCTQGDGQPYGSLIAFAVTDDLSAAIFSTPVATRKYRLLTQCDRVALLIDSRAEHPDNMMEVEALTATGRAVQVPRGEEFEGLAPMLIGRHPQLADFVRSPSCALFRIEIVRYFHVTRLQQVSQWAPRC
jgi:nitroimidazol reductase NimA-like FMN-containing flavoprotein (pyridoxamine 5'-phosphate oxidase superfamily)